MSGVYLPLDHVLSPSSWMPKLTTYLAAATAVLTLFLTASDGATQRASADSSTVGLQVGAHGALLLTRVEPILDGDDRTEAYLTQPTLFASLSTLAGRVHAQGALSLEPLTLKRGELGAGVYGEGYVDRRHPHTYVHEIMLSLEGEVGPLRASVAAGRGFAPFGTDDPMMRPFVKFPVNHHLAQVLERLILIAGVRWRDVLLEAATFQGREPLTPRDWGAPDRFGDSWSARATVIPREGTELQVSYAWVVSPEMPRGEGSDQRKWSVSARHFAEHDVGRLLLLAEWSRSGEIVGGREGPSWGGVLAEAQLERGSWRPALRVESTERPEESRSFDPFRTPWPHSETHLLGLTRWTILAARLERDFRGGALRAAPFGKISWSSVSETGGGVFDPVQFYGDDGIWTLNLGVRMGVGWHPSRMGRYGVARTGPSSPGAHAP